MLDLFTIFSKGGIVLWYFQGTCQALAPSVNALIKSVILQERAGSNTYTHDAVTLKYKLDNEFELVFVVAYQKILTLSYIDKFIDDVHQEFRDKYKDDLKQGNLSGCFDQFTTTFKDMLKMAESSSKVEARKPVQMRSFEQSQKSKKTVSSMIIDPKKEEKGKENKNKQNAVKAKSQSSPVINGNDAGVKEDEILKNRAKLFNKMKPKEKKKTIKATPEPDKKKGKQARIWNNSGGTKDSKTLDFSDSKQADVAAMQMNGTNEADIKDVIGYVGTMKGELENIETESEGESEDEEINDKSKTEPKSKSQYGFGMFNVFKGLVGSKTLTKEDIEPVLTKMRDHLI
ncbi:signal recognition particle receptor subunit alpha-like, partial [Saccoglossus kowalevskii]|uniref:Signal recognition particle receptor subunit alpha-like n=1 Tax=Saccoglossus kowalevskii TaxID=10224 RepID=A0ABM0GVI5_SACKO